MLRFELTSFLKLLLIRPQIIIPHKLAGSRPEIDESQQARCKEREEYALPADKSQEQGHDVGALYQGAAHNDQVAKVQGLFLPVAQLRALGLALFVEPIRNADSGKSDDYPCQEQGIVKGKRTQAPGEPFQQQHNEGEEHLPGQQSEKEEVQLSEYLLHRL